MQNLDTLSQYALHEFSLRHEGGANYKLLFIGMSPDVIPDTVYLACYAHCRWAEREWLSQGEAMLASLYTDLCKDYYAKLSAVARWRRN